MALEAVVFPQDYMFGGCGLRDQCGFDFGGFLMECEGGLEEEKKGFVENLMGINGGGGMEEEEEEERRKRRRRGKRSGSVGKNKEEVEMQRMTHIAVERNRRKLMNDYLAILRSIMPPSYVQRGDQASIVGGAINFVKELEQLLQSLEAQKRIKLRPNLAHSTTTTSSSPFADFFTFPQYSSTSPQTATTTTTTTAAATTATTNNQSPVADIEVTMVESHANLKVLILKRQPKQILKMVAGLEALQFTILHLNVTTVDHMVLYSFSLKVEDGCKFTSVDDIATAVYRMVGNIQEDSSFN